MSKDISHKRRDVIAEEAASYLVELQELNADTKAKFAAWLKTSPEHVEEFLALAELWGALPDIERQPSIDELVALAVGDTNVVDLDAVSDEKPHLTNSATSDSEPPRAPSAPSRLLRKWGAGLAAATIAAMAITAAIQFLPEAPDPNTYTTAIGEQTSLPLPDGSLVTLNTQSTLSVAYSDQFRDIHLTAGEALFDVTKDPGRPFRVITEHAVVTAVGTQFNVRNVADDVVVTVVEGIVDVEATTSASDDAGQSGSVPAVQQPAAHRSSERLTVGQQARVAAGEVAVIETEVHRATAWKERRLVFESLTLAEVIDEFNRYNDPPLLIDNPALRDLPISGMFRANDRASFVEFLKTMNLAQSETRQDGTIVLHRLDTDE